jgi:radical SAM-linked protein
MIYRPVRERAVDNIVLQSQEAIQNSGYDELSLLSLNTSDFKDLHWLMMKEKSLLSDLRLSFSFPSLRLDGLTPEMVDFVKTFRKGGFTFAPEAGSQRLRNVINKNLKEKDILDTLRLILDNGWQLVKFYFMIGLPTEKQQDLDAIVELVEKCVEISKNYKDVKINVSLSPFSPKPHTPFQWEKQEYPEVLEQKSRYLLDRLHHPWVSVSWRDGYTSSLETVFNRGGRELAAVLEEAWMQGARFDGWQEGFDWSRWEKAFSELEVDWKKYLKPLSVSVPLVWDHIDMGITKAFLQKEKTRAYEGHISPDCMDQVCLGCGLQRKEFENLVKCFQGEQNQEVSSQSNIAPAAIVPLAGNSKQSFGRSTKKRVSAAQMVKKRIRLRFTKTGLTRFISHLDIIRIFDRAARRAKISLVYSQGFHPRPKMAFGPPLGLGIASIAEYVDMEAEIGREADFQPRLNQVLPEGIEIVTQKPIFTKVPSLASAINRITYETFMENQEIDELYIEQLLSQEEILLTRQVKEEEREIDIRPFIHSIQKMNHSLIITLDALEGRMAKISEVLKALLEKHGLDYREFLTQRTGQFIKKGDEVLDPLQVI